MSAPQKKPPLRSAATAGPQARRTAPTVKDTRTPKERRTDGVLGLCQLAAGLLFQIPTLRPDAAAIAYYAGPLANEAAELADTDERAAALLDKIADIGPMGAIVTVITSLGMQIAANHGIIKAGSFGTMTPDALIDTVVERGENDESTVKP